MKIKALGIDPIITSSKEAWVMGMLFEGIATKAVGVDMSIKTLAKAPGGSFGDPSFRLAIDKLSELIDNGYINADKGAISRDEAREAFKNGEAALYYMGSWEVTSLEEDDSGVLGKLAWIPFPTIPGGNGLATEFNGGANDGVVINANTAHPEEAATFLKFFCQTVEGLGSYMPAWTTTQVTSTSQVFLKILDATSTATSYVGWWDTVLVGEDVSIYQEALDKYVNGVITADELVDELVRICP